MQWRLPTNTSLDYLRVAPPLLAVNRKENVRILRVVIIEVKLDSFARRNLLQLLQNCVRQIMAVATALIEPKDF